MHDAVLDDRKTADVSALLDRLLHHAHVLHVDLGAGARTTRLV
jgi:hypothetical protein